MSRVPRKCKTNIQALNTKQMMLVILNIMKDKQK